MTVETNASITIEDTTPPVITGVEDSYELDCDEDPAFSDPTATDECSAVQLLFTDETSGSVCTGFTITRTWVALDDCGNQAEASQTITFNCEPPEDVTTDDTVCEEFLPYEWNGQSITATGTYNNTVQDANGCEFDEILELEVFPTTPDDILEIEVCEEDTPYEWKGMSLTTSGEFTNPVFDANGCG